MTTYLNRTTGHVLQVHPDGEGESSTSAEFVLGRKPEPLPPAETQRLLSFWKSFHDVDRIASWALQTRNSIIRTLPCNKQ